MIHIMKLGPLPMGKVHCTVVCFASLFSGGFITAIVVNPQKGNRQNSPLCTGLTTVADAS